MNQKLKVMILTGSILVICICLYHVATVNAQTVDTGLGQVQVTEIQSNEVPVATAGDAGFLTTPRNISDLYNVCVRIAIELMFWVFWNVIRTVYRVLTERGQF